MNNDQSPIIPPNMTVCTVCVSHSNPLGNKEFSATISVQDRTTTGIADSLHSCGKEVIEQVDHARAGEPGIEQLLTTLRGLGNPDVAG